MKENRIRELRNPRDANDTVNKRFMNKRIEYKTKTLENKLTAIQTQITNIQQNLMASSLLPQICTWVTTKQ